MNKSEFQINPCFFRTLFSKNMEYSDRMGGGMGDG